MRFLWCTKDAPDGMDLLIGPRQTSLAKQLTNGRRWAGDNDAFSGFNAERFAKFLRFMEPHRDKCLFIVVPDVWSNAAATLERYAQYAPQLSDWPLAFAAQDGQDGLPFPDGFSTLFVGGSNAWMEGTAVVTCIKRAQAMGKHIHIGRINWARRYRLFRVLEGSEDFTCDGTRVRFDGRARTKKDWAHYEAQKPLIHL